MGRSTLVYIVILLVLCGGSYYYGTRSVTIVETTTIQYDTIRVDVPAEAVEQKEVEERVVYLTRVDTLTIRDSVLVYVPISEYTFKADSLYKITARGYDVNLTSVELYDRTITTTTTLIKSPTWEVAAVGGVNPFVQWVGGSATWRRSRWRASADVGYDFKNATPYVGVSGGVILFTK